MPLLSRRPDRYVPRHSTREVFHAWQPETVVDVTRGDSPTDVLESVLEALDGLDARERASV
ncbi:hypothetical protein [Kineococcus sp. NPDC059986]|jgi:hypothetical protein|uniref:hypothetical protein n=1 Tax=Kineococcus sp. NPDC059986 TaxID=3155538 RepID=UPI0034500F75